jgi:hypothetical protein
VNILCKKQRRGGTTRTFSRAKKCSTARVDSGGFLRSDIQTEQRANVQTVSIFLRITCLCDRDSKSYEMTHLRKKTKWVTSGRAAPELTATV